MTRKLFLAAGSNDRPPTGPKAGTAPLAAAPVCDIAHEVAGDGAGLSQALAELHASEARYRALTELSSEWYWEHDENQRFTHLTRKDARLAEIPQDSFIGKTRREVPGLNWDEPELAALEALMATRQPFQDFEIGRTYGNGPRQYLNLNGQPIFDASGRFAGYRGIGSNITERKRAEQVLGLEHAVARCLAEGGESSATIKELIRTICEIEQWDCGAWYRVDAPAGVPHRTETWSLPGSVAAEPDAGDVHGPVFDPAWELISRVWRSGEPAWVAESDVDTDGASRAGDPAPDGARGTGMSAAFAFPVTADGKMMGLLWFSGTTARPPDQRLLQAAGAIGSQIGQFLRRKQKEEELRESEARYRALTEMSADWYWEHDENQRLTKVSDHILANAGLNDVVLLGKTRWETGIQYDAGARVALEADIEARRPFRDFNFSRDTASGAERHVQISGEPMYDAAGRYCGYRGIGRDITTRIQAERAIRTNSMQQGLIAKFGQQALAITDIRELLASAVAAVVEGLHADCCSLLRFGQDGRPILLEAGAGWDKGWLGRELLEAGPGTQIGYLLERREPLIVEDFASEGRFAPAENLVFHGIKSGLEVMIGGAGAPYGILGGYSRQPCTFAPESVNFMQSIANVLGTAVERRHAEEKLAYLARYDSLTGLANRELFRDRLAKSLIEAERDKCMVGILYIDLDGFKNVNDSHGHDIGDQLLTLVAKRLQSCVRASDTVGRLGGDEFAIVLTRLVDADDADLVAEKVVEQLAQPFDLDGHETLITASIGISIYPANGTDANLLLKNADTAMYQGKDQGRNNFQNYSVELDHAAAGRRQMAQELRQALEHEEFELHYQPQVSLATGRIIGAEALLRWWHPVHGMLAAGEFIEVAEETGIILQIGQWVFETACKQAAEWQRTGFPEIFVAVNVSPVEIRRGKVVEQARLALEHSGLAPRFLEIDLTESVDVEDADSFANTLNELKELGISIAIDDFGTGYSSLSSLKNFPINKVKINQSFTRDIVAEPDDGAIVQAVIAMAHHLQLEVVSKGVETERQAGFLRRCRCDIAQGYLFGAPMQARYFKDLLDGSDGRLLPARSSLNGPIPQLSLATGA